MSLHVNVLQNPVELQEKDSKQPKYWWTDDKFQELLFEIAKESKEEKVLNGLMIGDVIFSKKQLSHLRYTAIKVYGGLYANGTPSYAQKYPNELRIDFMKRWDEIITNLEKIRDTLNKSEESAIIVPL